MQQMNSLIRNIWDMKYAKIFALLFLSFMVINTTQSQGENLSLTAPYIDNPLPSSLDGSIRSFNFTVFNVNGGYVPSCGATITIMMTDIAPVDGNKSVQSSTRWTWELNADGDLVGTLNENIGTLYFEVISVDIHVMADSESPGTNGFTAVVDVGACADGNATDNIASSTTWTEAPLPIELLSFSVKKRRNDAFLYWTTTNEINNDFFDIQRSYDGMEFQSIDKMDAAGTSYRALNYNYVDKEALTIAQQKGISTIHYRINQVDFDGKSSFTPIRSVEITNLFGNQKMVVYPNPASQMAQVSLPIANEEYTINVYNEIGQTIESFKSITQETLSVHGWTPGTYIVEAKHQESAEVYHEKLVVIK
jgi:hypothetical protein